MNLRSLWSAVFLHHALTTTSYDSMWASFVIAFVLAVASLIERRKA